MAVAPRARGRDKRELQSILASRTPVVVLGPGCRRIGYDTGPDWQELQRRVGLVLQAIGPDSECRSLDPEALQMFLGQFWVSKQSDEARHETEGDDPWVTLDVDIDSGGPRAPLDRARTALAHDVLCALFTATRCLGSSIATRTLPIRDWHEVSARGDEEELGMDARRFLESAAALAAALGNLAANEPLARADRQALRDHGLLEMDGASAIEFAADERDALETLKIDAVAGLLSDLVDRCFDGKRPTVDLSGAVVEWLSDLLWHLIRSDSDVPPSQAELAFYVNLGPLEDTAGDPWRFTRPRPGDYRRLKDRSGDSLSRDIETLLKPVRPRAARNDWSHDRGTFALTIAASLLEAWSSEESSAKQKEEQTGFAKARKPVVALVSDYDLMLERALARCLYDGEAFHVAVPVRIGALERGMIDWLLGTFRKGAGARVEMPEWSWLAEQPPRGDVKRCPMCGPVIVKLNGSPLHVLHEETNEPSVDDMDLATDEDSRRRELEGTELVKPIAVFSEPQSVATLMSLNQVAQSESLARSVFVDGLDWDTRNWLFLGHRFTDWLPRMGLFFNFYGLAGQVKPRPPTTDRRRLAVDRSFDWPELAVLDALAIKAGHDSLASISRYYENPTGETRRFLEGVEERVAHAR